jgi:hypothetical protein
MTRIILVLICCLSFFTITFSQNVGINATGAAPHATAMLDVQSTTKGFLMPRLSRAERVAIVNPAIGLAVYQTDFSRGFFFYDGSGWTYQNAMVSRNRAIYNSNWTPVADMDTLFVFGSDEMNNKPGSDDNARFFYNKQKNIFRAVLANDTSANTGYMGPASAAFGEYTVAQGGYSLAAGMMTNAKGLYSFAIGRSSISSGQFSMASGLRATSKGDYSFAVGSDIDAEGDYAISFGQFSRADGNYSVALGMNCDAAGLHSVAIGRSDATSDYAVAIGLTTKASGYASMATGMQTEASGEASVAMGDGTLASGQHSVASGMASSATGQASFVHGYLSSSTGPASIVLGDFSTASGISSVALGNSNEAQAAYSMAMGRFSVATGIHGVAMNYMTTAGGFNSLAMGNHTTTKAQNSVSAGFNTIAKSFAEVTIGQYNDTLAATSPDPGAWSTNDALFIAGNGTSNTTRSNAMTLYKDGALEVQKSITVGTKGTPLGNIQSRTIVLGPCSSSSGLCHFLVNFEETFTVAPSVVIVTPMHQQGLSVDDSFSATVRNVGTSGFIVVVKRLDMTSSWGQQLRLSYIAIQ